MKMTKQDRTLFQIVEEITSETKLPGDRISSGDYDLTKCQMGIVFQTLSENKIVCQGRANRYELTNNCKVNAQKLLMMKIIEHMQDIKKLAEFSHIDIMCLVDIFKTEMGK